MNFHEVFDHNDRSLNTSFVEEKVTVGNLTTGIGLTLSDRISRVLSLLIDLTINAKLD